ncbi:MAG: preprotein translocase subunit SecG [Planctomycetes bacterium]|nr:preprotein translocase subunit SecG [Planctomycetota bacterium]
MIEFIQMMQDAGIIIIWPISLILLLLILLQGGAGDISSSFGGGGQLDSSLGVGAASKISKVTGWLVALFLILVVILSINPDGKLAAAETAAGITGESADDAGVVTEEAVIPASSAIEAVPADEQAAPEVVAPEIEAVPEAAAPDADKPAADDKAVPAAPEIEVVE